MKVRHMFIDVDNGNVEVEYLLHGKYRVIGDPQLYVKPSMDERDQPDTEYTFVYRVGRID